MYQEIVRTDPNFPKEAGLVFEYGGGKKYWCGENIAEQLRERAIPIFEKIHPGCVAVFAFDNSSNHSCFASNALLAKRMNLGPGGKQPVMRPGWFNGHPQSMVFPPDHPVEELRGQPKGLKIVLQERGLWSENGLKARCKDGCEMGATDCCAENVMSLQEDFLAQKSLIREIIEDAGHKCIFYPKFHPELNYIEYFWGAVKYYVRRNCKYKYKELHTTVSKGLASVPLLTIRKFAKRAKRYMSVYRLGLSLKDAEYAVKKYRSHRRIPLAVVADK